MKSKITEDLSILTTIPVATLDRLVNKASLCIADSVEKCIYDKSDKCEIDIGIGTLTISLANDLIKYRFTPNQTLENLIKTTVVDEKNPLENVLEESLVNKIQNIYKDLF